jgi:hypothetical protein
MKRSRDRGGISIVGVFFLAKDIADLKAIHVAMVNGRFMARNSSNDLKLFPI